MKSFASENYLRDEYYRDHTIAVDLIEIHLKFVGKEPEGKRVVVYKVFLDINTLQIVGTEDSAGQIAAINMFDGEVYNVSIQETATSCGISVEASSHFADFERQAGRRTNDWSNWLFQGVQYDTAFEKAGFVGNQEFLWGRTE